MTASSPVMISKGINQTHLIHDLEVGANPLFRGFLGFGRFTYLLLIFALLGFFNIVSTFSAHRFSYESAFTVIVL